MKTFYAQEPHLDGTTKYEPGDKREADEHEVRHLVDLKVLGEKPPAKAEEPVANKAEGKAPANKSA